jgi:hypothetical protein
MSGIDGQYPLKAVGSLLRVIHGLPQPPPGVLGIRSSKHGFAQQSLRTLSIAFLSGANPVLDEIFGSWFAFHQFICPSKCLKG